jgi:hypothetical protein
MIEETAGATHPRNPGWQRRRWEYVMDIFVLLGASGWSIGCDTADDDG